MCKKKQNKKSINKKLKKLISIFFLIRLKINKIKPIIIKKNESSFNGTKKFTIKAAKIIIKPKIKSSFSYLKIAFLKILVPKLK